MEEINFEQWFIDHFKPCCYVYSTDLAKAIIRKNNLSPSEFLRPFADFTPKKIDYFSGRKISITTISDFRVDCYDCDNETNCINLQQEFYYDYLIRVFSHPSIYPDWSLYDNKGIKDTKTIISKLKKNSFPWMNIIESTFFESLRFDPCEFYQQPLFNVYLCSSLEKPDCLNEEIRAKMVSGLIKTGIYENPKITILIILNDNSDPLTATIKKSIVQSNYQNLYNSFNVKLWDINTLKEGENKSKDLWSRYFHNIDIYHSDNQRTSETVYGQLVSIKEQQEFINDFYEIFSKYVVSLIQGEIPKLEEQINELKGSWFFSSKSDLKIEYVTELKLFKLKEIDKCRVTLGMIYFYFRDYENVQNVFRKIDTKAKQNQQYLPFINQINLICNYILTNGQIIKSEYDKSYFKFLKQPTDIQSFQSMFIVIRMLEHLQMYDEIRIFVFHTDKLLKSGSNNPSHFENVHNCLIPVWLEKASLSYVTNKNYYRKFCLCMFQAGTKFLFIRNPIQNRYAINALGWLFYIFDNVSFSFIRLKDYLNNLMGDMCMNIEYHEGAHRFFKNCLELAKYNLLSSTNQKKYLKCFLDTLDSFTQQKGNKLGALSTSSLTIPEISNTTVLIIENQDYAIKQKATGKEVLKNQPWAVLCKYSYVQLHKAYANLSDNDLVILRILDEILKSDSVCCNLYARRHFQGRVNEMVHITFMISNPLDTDIDIVSMQLICEFKPEQKEEENATEDTATPKKNMVEYQKCQMLLPPKSMKKVQLYFTPLVPGQCIIKGVSMNLSPIAEIRHFFNQKNLSKLYSYRNRFKSAHSSDHGRRSTISSHSSSLMQEPVHKKKIVLNRKADIVYDVLTDASDILIVFPMGTDIEMFHNELVMMPVLIENNSSYKIKRFSIFTLDSEGSPSPHSFVCDNIFKEIDLNGKNNKTEVFIPFVPLFIRKYFVKILIKFEDEAVIKQIDIKRFIVTVTVKPSVRLVFNEEIFNMDTISPSNKITSFNLKATAFLDNKDSLSDLAIGTIIHNTEFSITNKTEWNHLLDNSADKLYSIINCIRKQSNEPKTVIRGNILDCLTDETSVKQPHIKKKFSQIVQNDRILFNWSATDNNNNKPVNGVFVYSPLLKLPQVTPSFLQGLVSHSIQFDISQLTLNDTDTVVTLVIRFNKKGLFEIKDIVKYKFYSKKSDAEFRWFGLKQYLIQNTYQPSSSPEVKLRFSFMTKLKGEMNANMIRMKFYLKTEGSKRPNVKFKLTDAPFPIMINIK